MAGANSSAATQHVGPIIFSDETARGQLVTEGIVTTFRKSARTTGETWWRTSRTGPKRGNVTVRSIQSLQPTPYALARHVEHSGFADTAEWLAAIRELNGGVPDHGYIYEVRTR